MEKNLFIKKAMAFVIIILFIVASFMPSISGNVTELDKKQSIKSQKQVNNQEDVLVTCYTFGMPGESSKEIEIPLYEAEYLLDKIKELNYAVASDPLSDKTQRLQNEIVDLADGYGLLPTGLSKSKAKEHLIHSFTSQTNGGRFLPQTQSKASEFLCTFVSTGSGSVLPIIALPRLIPILMIPIPRLFMIWRAQEAVTSCGGLRSGTGFIAYGQQNGIAIGFWGLGFTFSLPPLMGVYGLAGYSLYASVNADIIEFYPPNSPPVISQIDPGDGEINVPLSLSELRFQISDINGELMSYTVTTSPDIGSGSGNLKPDGVYSVPISGLEDLTEYSWHIEVTDGKDNTIDDFTFTTEAIAPIISDPFPKDGSRHTSVDLSQLSFHLKDFQGDPMDYTVETVPDIGSGGETGVGDGIHTIPINGLDFDTEYSWYVNVTDGTHWTYKIFHFKTRLEPGPWWDEIWSYRKYLGVIDASSDCQIVLKVWKEDGHDSPENGNIDCEDHCNESFSDIRFVTFDGVECKYWIEKIGTDGGEHYAIIWVKLPSSDDEELYLYYGNTDASGESSGDDTFIFFDDFEGADYNHDIWYTDGSAHTWTVSNSIMTMQSTGDPGVPGAHFILKPEASISVPYGHMWYTKLSSKRDPNSWATMPYIGSYTSEPSPDDDNMYMWYRSAGGDHMRTCYGFNGVLGGINDDISSESWTDDAWHYFIMQRDQNAPYASFQVLKEDKVQWGNKVEITLEYYDDFSPFEFYYYQRPYTSGGNTKVDWVFVAKYEYPSPSWGSFGYEESSP